LQSSGNEIGTGNTETSNGMKTSVNIENIPEFSSYFQSEYGMMGVSDLNSMFGNA